jgi:intracellular sulfur oxidation DsrE/DsrF family protein
MTGDGRPSEEMLNAFVDGEFSGEDQRQMLERMARDPVLNDAVCELRTTKQLVQLAYGGFPHRTARASRGRGGLWLRAAVIAGVFVTGGLLGHLTLDDPRPVKAVTAAAQDQPSRVLVHLNDNDPSVAFEVLDDLERMLADFDQRGEDVQIEVIANGDGLDLVRADTTPISEEITRLIQKYPNLTVAACRSTIDQLWEDYGVMVDLIPGVKQIDSGVAEVIRRQQEGWAYIRG